MRLKNFLRWRPRFSLLALVLFSLLVGSGWGLCEQRAVWALARTFDAPKPANFTPRMEAGALLSPGKTKFCLRTIDGVVRMFDAQSGALLWEWAIPPEFKFFSGNSDSGMEFVEDGRRLKMKIAATDNLGREEAWRLMDVESGRLLPPTPRVQVKSSDLAYRVYPKPLSASGQSYSKDGTRTVIRNESSNQSSQWLLKEIPSEKLIAGLKGGYEPRGSSFSPDGRFVATACYSGEVNLYDGKDGRFLQALEKFPMARLVEFCEDSEWLVVTERRWKAKVYQKQRELIWDRRLTDHAWGFLEVPGVWLMVFFTGLVGWSFWRDVRRGVRAAI